MSAFDTGNWRDAQLLSTHFATKVMCIQCWNTNLWCATPFSNIWSPHRRWCNRWQPTASFMTSSPKKKCLCPSGSALARNLQPRRKSDQVCMMYNSLNRLIDLYSAAGLPSPVTAAPGGTNTYSRTDTYLYSHFPLAIQLWNSVPTGALSAVTQPSFRSALMAWMEGRA